MARLGKLPGLMRQAKREGWSQWVRSVADEKAVLNGCWFDIRRANRFERFCNGFLRLFQGRNKGTPVELLPWQRDDYTFPLYGWVRENDEGKIVRRYRRAFVFIAKKNGKSTLVAAQCLYHLSADGEAGAEVYAVANDEKQSGRIFAECNRMVVCSPELIEEIDIIRSELTLRYDRRFGTMRAISSNPDSAEGMNASAMFGDEMHKWQSRELLDAIQWAGIARDQPLFGIITTAGSDLESPCFEEYVYACGVRDGTIEDEQYLPVIFEAPTGKDILDESTWKAANPSLGKTLKIDDFRKDAKRAARSPRATAAFRRYRLNQWVAAGDKWIDPVQWASCARPFKPEDLAGKGYDCFAGLDLSRVADTTSLQLLFRLPEGRRAVLSYFWLPREAAAEAQERINYADYEGRGEITITDGEVQDYAQIFEDIARLHKLFRFRNLIFDPYNAEEITQKIASLGVKRWAMAQTKQYFTGPVDHLERLIRSRSIEHNGNKLMSFQMGNARIVQDSSGGKKPMKKNSDSLMKVDGPVALLMAVAGDLEAGESTGASIRWA